MGNATATRHRSRTATILALGGGALALATWVGGEHGLAVGLLVFYALAALAAYLWSGRDTDVAAIMRAEGDERQRRLDHDATALAGLAMGITALVGAIISAAVNHGDIGPFGLICAVGGTTYAVSLAVLRSRG
jgi:hypothetical protein